jgi:hypothetical protein
MRHKWYEFKCWLWYRFTTIKPRYLGHTWTDRDELLAHMMFEILCQFIERECSPGDINWYEEDWPDKKVEVDGQEKWARDELQDLYDWWIKGYNDKRLKDEEAKWKEIKREVGDKINLKNEQYRKMVREISVLERQWEDELNIMLARLLKMRKYMWT